MRLESIIFWAGQLVCMYKRVSTEGHEQKNTVEKLTKWFVI